MKLRIKERRERPSGLQNFRKLSGYRRLLSLGYEPEYIDPASDVEDILSKTYRNGITVRVDADNGFVSASDDKRFSIEIPENVTYVTDYRSADQLEAEANAGFLTL